MWFFTILVFAFLTTVLQVSFFSHLPLPLADVFIPVIAISYAVFTDRPIAGALWALIAGFTLDLHGMYAFGTELALLLIVFYVLRIAFRRFITNSTILAIFLLTASGILIHWLGLVFLDGIQVLFGSIPQIISFESRVIASLTRSVLINGIIVVGLLLAGKWMKRRFEHLFLLHS